MLKKEKNWIVLLLCLCAGNITKSTISIRERAIDLGFYIAKRAASAAIIAYATRYGFSMLLGGKNFEIKSENTLEQWIGTIPEEIKLLIDRQKNPSKYSGFSFEEHNNSLLLAGPPGNGKTLLARSVAHDLNVPYFEMGGTQVHGMLHGSARQTIQRLFAQARSKSCKTKAISAVIFIDEIDAFARSRLHQDPNPQAQEALVTLLIELNNQNNNTILVLAATNHPEVLDSAITRGGRFGSSIVFNNPDELCRKELIADATARTFRHSGYIDGAKQPYILYRSLASSDIWKEENMEQLVQQTQNFSCADIYKIMNDVLMRYASNYPDKSAQRIEASDILKQIAITKKHKALTNQ